MSWERLAQIQRQSAPYLEAHPRASRFRVENKTTGETELFVYGEIGGPWGVSAEQIGKALRAVSPSPVTIRVHSEGGSAFEGVAIHSLLKDYAGPVDVKIDGLAASAGSIIAVAGDYVSISPGGQVLVHDATALTVGDSEDHRFMANLLNVTSDTIAKLYARRTGDDAAIWRERMLASKGLGSWFNAEQAVDFGLADEIFEASSDRLGAQVAANLFRVKAELADERRQEVASLTAASIVGVVRRLRDGIRRGIREGVGKALGPPPPHFRSLRSMGRLR